MPLILPNTITNGQPHDGALVQQNFEAIRDNANNNLVNKDGSIAFTQPQAGVTPVSASHLVTKDYVDTRLSGPTAYTPAWTSSGTQPNLGTTGTASGQWWQIGNNLYVCEVAFKYGGTGIVQGTGSYRISLPFTAAKFGGFAQAPMQGLVTVYDNSADQSRAFLTHVNAHGDAFVVLKGYHTVSFSSDADITGANVGITFAANDVIVGKLFFTKV